MHSNSAKRLGLPNRLLIGLGGLGHLAAPLLGGFVGGRLPLFAFPPHAHGRHLVGLERRHMGPYEDVHLLEQRHQLLGGDAEFGRQFVNARLPQPNLSLSPGSGRADDTVRQRPILHPDRLHRRPAQSISQRRGVGSRQEGDVLPRRESRHFFHRPRLGIAREHHTHQFAGLQRRPYPIDPDDQVAAIPSQPQQPQQRLIGRFSARAPPFTEKTTRPGAAADPLAAAPAGLANASPPRSTAVGRSVWRSECLTAGRMSGPPLV